MAALEVDKEVWQSDRNGDGEENRAVTGRGEEVEKCREEKSSSFLFG